MLAHIPFSSVPVSGMCPKEMSLRRILLVSPLQNHRKWTTQSKSSPKKQKPTPKRFSFPSSLRNMTPTTGLPYGQRYVHLVPTPPSLTPTVSQRPLGKPRVLPRPQTSCLSQERIHLWFPCGWRLWRKMLHRLRSCHRESVCPTPLPIQI